MTKVVVDNRKLGILPDFISTLLPAEAIILSATIASFIAVFSLTYHGILAKRRATLDVILKSESDAFYVNLHKAFVAAREATGGLLNSSVEALHKDEIVTKAEAKTVTPVDASKEYDPLDLDIINDFLNHYELIAVGISRGILDHKTYKTWMRGSYVDCYLDSYNYIYYCSEIRGEPKCFIMFKYLAEKWAKDEFEDRQRHHNLKGEADTFKEKWEKDAKTK